MNIVDLVVEDLRGRDAVGRVKYGRPLAAHNGRNALRDAYEEALDLAMYLRQRLEEDGPPDPAIIKEHAGDTTEREATILEQIGHKPIERATAWIPWTEEMQEYHDLLMHGGKACSCSPDARTGGQR